MKQYQITFNVPDDFVPEDLQLSAAYGDGSEVSIDDEGFIEETGEELFKDILDKVSFTKDTVGEHDIIRITFKSEIDSNMLQSIMKYTESVYGCPCICYLDDLDVLVENADDAIKMFNGMIAKIKTRAAVKDTSGIILT